MEMEIKNMCNELFQSILIDGFTQSNLVKTESLLDSISDLKDFKGIEEDLLALICVLDTLEISNTLIKLNLKTIKVNFIKYKVDKKEEVLEETSKETISSCNIQEKQETPKLSYDFFPDIFDVESGNRKRAKDKTLWSNNEKEHSFFSVVDENNTTWEFAVDHEGYLTEYRHNGDLGETNENVDYDEIYSALEDEVLKFRDGSSGL